MDSSNASGSFLRWFRIEEVIAELGLATSIKVAVLAADVTVGITVWVALPMGGRVVPFATIGIALAALQLLIAEVTNSFKIAFKVKATIGFDAVKMWCVWPKKGWCQRWICPSYHHPGWVEWWCSVCVLYLQQTFNLAWLSLTFTWWTHSLRLSEQHCVVAPMEPCIMWGGFPWSTLSGTCKPPSSVRAFPNESCNVWGASHICFDIFLLLWYC